MLRGQLQQGRCITGIASLAVVVLVQTAGVHLEDDEVLERCVGQGRFVGDVADALRRLGEVRAQPVGDELDLDLPAARVAVQNGAGLFDEGADRVADDFLLDAAGGGGFADDEVDALKVRVRWCARVLN